MTFSEGQTIAIISLAIVADGLPELSESVMITIRDVTTLGLQNTQQGAVIDRQRAQALLTILPNGSPYGVIGWHLDSQFTLIQEPQSKNLNAKFCSYLHMRLDTNAHNIFFFIVTFFF